jgi:small subunit ribosomal protein S8
MTDPIADMIIRIKNGLMAGLSEVTMPHSKMKESLASILKKESYIADYSVSGEKAAKEIKVTLKYIGASPVISGVKRISKPGRRIYRASKMVPRTLNGYGLTIVSTNKGVMDAKQALKNNLGGEVLCQIW